MAASDVPATLLILLPGFLALQVFRLVSPGRRPSDLETLLWSLAAAFAILTPTTVVWHQIDCGVPSLVDLIKYPPSVPMRLTVVLYAAAPLAGGLVGHLDRSQRLERWAERIGVDLSRRRDVWFLAFRDPYYVRVYLKNGDLLYGWPERISTDRRAEATEIYLTNTFIWDMQSEKWVPQTTVAGGWIDATGIERIEFTKELTNSERAV
jgi:hypothetical protein